MELPSGIAPVVLTVIIFLVAVLSLVAQQKPDCKVRVTLLPDNFVHQFAPVDQGARGGLARLLTLKKAKCRKESPNKFSCFPEIRFHLQSNPLPTKVLR